MTKTVAEKIDSLVVFGNLKTDEVVAKLRLLCLAEEEEEKVARYADFVTALFRRGYDFSAYLLSVVEKDDNIYSEKRARREEIPPILAECVAGELQVLQALADIDKQTLADFVGYKGFLPPFATTKIDFAAEYNERMENLRRVGYGIFADGIMFRLTDDGTIEPVKSPDLRGIERLVGYERERQLLIDNTLALVEGRPAANAFLYGDAGTGKSSTIKAVVNMLADRGLRLIEVRKNQLMRLSQVMESLRNNPLKFIIFIDDISFNSADDSFGILKTALEGSTAVKSDNTVIYATSNRRHLVKESFSDRDGDDIHRNDTIQETAALSARFGLTILFARPNRALYLKIARELVKARNINIDDKELEIKADAFALQKGGYSPRAAEQFADELKARS